MLPGDFTVSEGHGHPLVVLNTTSVHQVSVIWFVVLSLACQDTHGSKVLYSAPSLAGTNQWFFQEFSFGAKLQLSLRRSRKARNDPLKDLAKSGYKRILKDKYLVIFPYTINYNHTLGDHLFVTLTNCDLNVYSHIPYNPLQDCDYKKKKLQNSLFMLK